ncbi:MAG: hypothetical protein PHW10_03475 [Candidatus Peribacteraceae bacterium]|nr:hypothetical protein [Candidatus Peribacteraceae bacterium]
MHSPLSFREKRLLHFSLESPEAFDSAKEEQTKETPRLRSVLSPVPTRERQRNKPEKTEQEKLDEVQTHALKVYEVFLDCRGKDPSQTKDWDDWYNSFVSKYQQTNDVQTRRSSVEQAEKDLLDAYRQVELPLFFPPFEFENNVQSLQEGGQKAEIAQEKKDAQPGPYERALLKSRRQSLQDSLRSRSPERKVTLSQEQFNEWVADIESVARKAFPLLFNEQKFKQFYGAEKAREMGHANKWDMQRAQAMQEAGNDYAKALSLIFMRLDNELDSNDSVLKNRTREYKSEIPDISNKTKEYEAYENLRQQAVEQRLLAA